MILVVGQLLPTTCVINEGEREGTNYNELTGTLSVVSQSGIPDTALIIRCFGPLAYSDSIISIYFVFKLVFSLALYM